MWRGEEEQNGVGRAMKDRGGQKGWIGPRRGRNGDSGYSQILFSHLTLGLKSQHEAAQICTDNSADADLSSPMVGSGAFPWMSPYLKETCSIFSHIGYSRY